MTHPKFRASPLLTLGRLLLWEIFKVLRHSPTVAIHARSRMRLQPGTKRGIHGLVFVFRDAYEPSVRYAIDRYATIGATCYDIGASVGLWTLRMSEAVGASGRVYAYEPLSRNRSILDRNLALTGCANVEVIPVALGAARGRTLMYIPEDPGASSLAPETPHDATEDVPVASLDEIWRGQGRPSVSLAKIDVEGSEPLVLGGGEEFFSTVRPVVCCEINPRKLAPLGLSADAILQRFRSWRYEALVWDARSGGLRTWHLMRENAEIPSHLVFDVVFLPARGALS